MAFTSRKLKDLNSSVDMIRRLLEELPVLKQMDRESEFHLDMHEEALATDFLNHWTRVNNGFMKLYTVDYTTEEECAKYGYTLETWAIAKEKRRLIPKDQWIDRIKTEILLLSNYPEFKKFKDVLPDWQILRAYRGRFDMTQRAALNLPEHIEQEEQIEM